MGKSIPIILPELQYRDSTRVFNDDDLVELLGSIASGIEQLVAARDIEELTPDVAAWAGHGIALCSYGMAVQAEIKERGMSYVRSDLAALQYLCAAREESAEYPRWTYDISIVSQHKKALQSGINQFFFPDPPRAKLFLRGEEYAGEEDSFYSFRPAGPFHQAFGWFWVDERNRPNKQWLRGTTEGMHHFIDGPLQSMELETQELRNIKDSELEGYTIVDSDETMLGDPILVWGQRTEDQAA